MGIVSDFTGQSIRRRGLAQSNFIESQLKQEVPEDKIVSNFIKKFRGSDENWMEIRDEIDYLKKKR